MNRLKSAVLVVALTVTLSSSAFAGTIIGARSNRTGTIIGARTGTIIGARNNTPTSQTATGTSADWTKRNSSAGAVMSESILTMLRLLIESSLF